MNSFNDFQQLHNEAHDAGMAAVRNTYCVPMIVQQHADPLNDNSPVVYQEQVDDGVCGFAWISFPGNDTHGRWAKGKRFAWGSCREGYPKGLQISVSLFNQSMQKKEAYAVAYAKYLRDRGVKAHADSCLD
jgi:hypothetical protein